MEAVHFYESNRRGASELPPMQRLEIMEHYILALEMLGDYRRLLSEVDDLIVLCLSDEVEVDEGRLIYEQALYVKAKAHYRMMEYAAASHILAELARMNPERKDYLRSRVHCLYSDKPPLSRRMYAVVVVCVLSAAVVIFLETLFVNTLHPKYADGVRLLRNVLLGTGIGVFVLTELSHWLRCEWRVWRSLD
jgi:hypothetical protein